jgi:hypothetical protein
MTSDQPRESSIETIEIEAAARASRINAYNYDPLPTTCDCCVESIKWAMQRLGSPQCSSDLNVSPEIAADGWAEKLLLQLPPELHVNRLRVRQYLSANEWYIECGDGRAIGCNPV